MMLLSRFQQGLGAVCVLLAVVVLLGVAGCGSEPYSMVPVSGTVTYEDGSAIPASRIRVVFNPQAEAIDAATHPRPGEANVDMADGTFSQVTSHKFGDGVTVGKHKIQVISLDEMENETDAVPEIYRRVETTPLEFDIDKGSNDIELKIKKP